MRHQILEVTHYAQRQPSVPMDAMPALPEASAPTHGGWIVLEVSIHRHYWNRKILAGTLVAWDVVAAAENDQGERSVDLAFGEVVDNGVGDVGVRGDAEEDLVGSTLAANVVDGADCAEDAVEVLVAEDAVDVDGVPVV